MGNSLSLCCGSARKPSEENTTHVKKTDPGASLSKAKFEHLVLQNSNNTLCTVCTRPVYPAEKAVDTASRVYHKLCLKCKTCGKKLHGAQVVLVAKTVYCAAHDPAKAPLRVKAVQAADPRVSVPKDTIIKVDVSTIRNRIGDQLEMSMSSMIPSCSRCGGDLEDGSFVISGMEKFHKQCPKTGAVASKQSRKSVSIRSLVLQAPESLVVAIGESGNATRLSTFFFIVDETARKGFLASHRIGDKLSVAEVAYSADQNARASTVRPIQLSKCVLEALQLQFTVKLTMGFFNQFPKGVSTDATIQTASSNDEAFDVVAEFKHTSNTGGNEQLDMTLVLEFRIQFTEVPTVAKDDQVSFPATVSPVRASLSLVKSETKRSKSVRFVDSPESINPDDPEATLKHMSLQRPAVKSSKRRPRSLPQTKFQQYVMHA